MLPFRNSAMAREGRMKRVNITSCPPSGVGIVSMLCSEGGVFEDSGRNVI